MTGTPSSQWECDVCGYVYDESKEGTPWSDLPDDWECPICGATRDQFTPVGGAAPPETAAAPAARQGYLADWARASDDLEHRMTAIHQMAETGESLVEPMGARRGRVSWDDVLIKGAQLARLPLNPDEPVSVKTTLGPGADHPLVIDTPVYVSHMSFGALSREAKLAMARGSAEVGTAMCSGEGGALPECVEAAHRYIFEYVPNRYSVTDELLQRVAAVEIKIGQAAKPGMGGHLPGDKVTAEIAAVRNKPQGRDVHSPARFGDIATPDDLKRKVDWLREKTSGKPIGVKLAAGHIEADISIALRAGADFITIDGRPGATGSAPLMVKEAMAVPTLYALRRARRCLDEMGADNVSLVITGGLRVSADFAKALALGADAVAIATAAMIACGCQQYRVCNTGKCPVGIATQDSDLRSRLDIDESARRLANFLRVSTEELRCFARCTGHADIHDLTRDDLCTTNPDIAAHAGIDHA